MVFTGYVKQHRHFARIIMLTGAGPSARDMAMDNGGCFSLRNLLIKHSFAEQYCTVGAVAAASR